MSKALREELKENMMKVYLGELHGVPVYLASIDADEMLKLIDQYTDSIVEEVLSVQPSNYAPDQDDLVSNDDFYEAGGEYILQQARQRYRELQASLNTEGE